jgi:Tol biopolymer transport system component
MFPAIGGDGQSCPSSSRFCGRPFSAVFCLLLALLCNASRLDCQLFVRPWLDWRTIRSGRFDVHYPSEMAAWARFVAERMPAIDSSVSKLVGYSPPMRVQIVVEDPFDDSNGFAFTVLDHPVIVFWAAPPDPRESIGQFRTWPEMLAVHEFGHMAHLTRPSRNPFTRLLWRMAPVNLGPIAYRSPRWVIEGYATYIEGVVTGSGRPHGVWRPATLRQWAIEGRLPSYAQLSSWNDFDGGEFAYLAGSAFLEWLARRNGDSSLVDIWRRLTARTNRSFDEAFAGVYGDPPAVLYDRFRAEVTANSVAIDSALAREGLVEGELVQHLSRATGDPAVSRDGQHVAIVLRSAGRAPRVVVWRSASEPDTNSQRARQRLLQRDPEDVPARHIYPAAKRALATLVARDGRAFEDPRWFPDGRRLLLWRSTRRPDGSLRPELYVWNYVDGGVRRLTHEESVRVGDVSPDGRSVAALRCRAGRCDVVVIDVASGSSRTVAPGDALTSYARPRWSPDGRTIAVAVQRENRWRIALIDPNEPATRIVDPDDGANRFDPAWLGPEALVVVSDQQGAPNLERLDLSGAATAHPLTRIAGAAIAPDVSEADSSIWFLSLHSQGYDVRRLAPPMAIAETSSPLLDPRLVPVVVNPSSSVRVFSPSPISAERRYALGDRQTRWLPAGSGSAIGREATLGIINSDAVGRLTMLGQAAFGSGDVWRGGALDVTWRGSRPSASLSLFDAITTNPVIGDVPPALISTERLSGVGARTDYSYAFDRASIRASLGGSLSRVALGEVVGTYSSARDLVFGELAGAARQIGDAASFNQSVLVHGDIGESSSETFERLVVSLGGRVGVRGFLPLDLGGTYGIVSQGAVFEQFVIGGLPTTLIDPSLLTQRVLMAVLPTDVAHGDHVLTYRVATSLFGLTPYYWGGSAQDETNDFTQWHRVVGAELTIDQTPVSVLGLPGARLIAGVGRSLDPPFADRTRGYFIVLLRP